MELTYLGVFAAGLLTFISPCVLPMVPIIAANYLMSGSESQLAKLKATLLFSLGFMMTFTLMGLSLPTVTGWLGGAKNIFLIVSGIFIILYGLKMSGLAFKNSEGSKVLSWMSRSFYFPEIKNKMPRSLQGFLFGATFGLSWTPCVGPILGGVLAFVASNNHSVLESTSLMLTFAMGIVLPFILLAIAGDMFQGQLDRLKKYLPKIEEFTGYGLIFVGAMVLFQSHLPTLSSANNNPLQTSFINKQGQTTTLSEVQPKAHKLLFFYTDHCPICHAMESFMPALERDCQSNNFQIVRINAEKAENQQLAQQFHVTAVPTMSLISPKGEEMAHTVGYQSRAKLEQAIQFIDPNIQCASSPVDKNIFEPKIKEGQSCSDNGLSC